MSCLAVVFNLHGFWTGRLKVLELPLSGGLATSRIACSISIGRMEEAPKNMDAGMTVFRYTMLLGLGFAFCAGCGDSSSQPWEKTKSPPAAVNAGEKPGDVADNDAAININRSSGEADAGRGMTSPHAGMMMQGNTSSGTLENDGSLDIGPLHWTVPKTWVRKAPGMVAAEYSVPKADGDKQDARLTVSQFGGTVEANIDRWKGQFSKKLDKEEEKPIDVGGVKATLVDLSGTFDDSRPDDAGGDAARLPHVGRGRGSARSAATDFHQVLRADQDDGCPRRRGQGVHPFDESGQVAVGLQA